MTTFINQSGLDFTDISSEAFREYNFGKDGYVKILNPLKLHVSENGHRIFDAGGSSHYIPMGWISLRWVSKAGQANFIK